MTANLPPLLTAEEFARLPNPADGSLDELVNGRVVIVGAIPTARHGLICVSIGTVLGRFVEQRDSGHLLMRCGIILQRNPDTVRGPDLSYFRFERMPDIPEDYPDIPPDLVVEVRERNESRDSMLDRISDYLHAGVPLVWLVDPETKTVTTYAGSMRGTEYDETDTLDGGSVLPGFLCPVAELFP